MYINFIVALNFEYAYLLDIRSENTMKGFQLHLLIHIMLFVSNNFHLVLSYNTSDVNTIHTNVFNGYEKNVLPAYPVDVKSEYSMLTINFLDVKTQTLSTSGWFTLEWIDARLIWNNNSFTNITYIYAPQSKLWHPEIIAQNAVEGTASLSDDSTHESQLKIRYDGKVRWEPSAILSTSCDIDITYFPYDSQSCEIKLASTGYHNDAVNLTFLKPYINRKNYNENGEWEIITTSQHSAVLDDEGFEYAELVFQINLHRRPGHFFMSILFPTILIAVLTTATFLIPVASGDKVAYMLPVLLTLVILLTLFDSYMPSSSKHTSLLVVFLTVTLALASFAIVLTIAIIWLHHQPDEFKAPACLHKIAMCLKKIRHKENSIEDNNANENGAGEKSEIHLNPLSTQELADVLDKFSFAVFAVIYIGCVLSFTITLAVGGRSQ